jgi:hypothetical protein
VCDSARTRATTALMSMAMAIILKALFTRKKEGKGYNCRQRGKGRGKKGRDVCQGQSKLELWGKQKSQELYFEVGWEVRPVLYACTMAVRHPFQVRGTEYFLLYL